MRIRERIKPKEIWNKYGLIVVGNIVFFFLLYWFSYRPHNTENRAGELLSMAQTAETSGHHQTAGDIYEKILADYDGTRAAETAAKRAPELKKTLTEAKVVQPDCPSRCEDLNLEEMLRKDPTVYVATHMAKHYNRFPADREKVREIILKNLKAAHEWANIPVTKLRGESEFQSPVLQKAFFDLQPKCEMDPDWIWDNFFVRNDNFFAWSGAVIEMTVTQGEAREKKIIRPDSVAAGERLDVLELRVRKKGGPVTCTLSAKTDQGKAETTQEL